MPISSNKPLDAAKAWLTPLLLLALSTVLWNQQRDMQSDIKILLQNDSYKKAKIEALEKEVEDWKKLSDNKKSNIDKYFKHEPIFQIKNKTK